MPKKTKRRLLRGKFALDKLSPADIERKAQEDLRRGALPRGRHGVQAAPREADRLYPR